jgi:hypothetical protein
MRSYGWASRGIEIGVNWSVLVIAGLPRPG